MDERLLQIFLRARDEVSYEQNRIASKAMLGSAERARDLLEEVSAFAHRTPFELPQVVEGAKRLMAHNVAQKGRPHARGVMLRPGAGGRPDGTIGAPAGTGQGPGGMFWLNRERFPGSYFRLVSASRAKVGGG